MAQRRLTADDWAAAAFRALSGGGLAAVAVEPIAASLGATKGSFYWHFANRDALVTAALDYWERHYTEAVIAAIDTLDDPVARLRDLFRRVSTDVDTDRTEVNLLASADHPLVAPVLRRVTERRVSYLAGTFEQAGFGAAEARRRAVLAISVYLGQAQLVHAAPGLLPAASERRAYLDETVAALLAR